MHPNPHLINIICDLALLSGYVRETKIIESDIVKECTANVLIPNQQNAEVIKDPKGLAKTLKKTNIKKLASLKDFDSEVGKKMNTRPARHNDFYIAGISVLSLMCILGFLYYFYRNNTFIGNLKHFLEQSLSHQQASKPEPSSLKSQMA
jgi:hypothetical protein